MGTRYIPDDGGRLVMLGSCSTSLPSQITSFVSVLGELITEYSAIKSDPIQAPALAKRLHPIHPTLLAHSAQCAAPDAISIAAAR